MKNENGKTMSPVKAAEWRDENLDRWLDYDNDCEEQTTWRLLDEYKWHLKVYGATRTLKVLLDLANDIVEWQGRRRNG